MKRYAKPATEIPPAPVPQEEQLISDVSVQRLIDKSLTALQREVTNILALSAKGKLDANTARDLRDHLKLLFELKDREKDFLNGLTDEQIEELLAKRGQIE